MTYWFKFDDNAANTSVYDEITTSNATASGSTSTMTAAGKVGSCFYFQGARYVDCPVNYAKWERTQAFSIVVWSKKGQGYHTFFSNNTSLNHATKGISWFTYTFGLYLQLNSGSSYGNNELQVYAIPSPFDGSAWIMFAVTYDGSSSASGVKMYANGISQTITVAQNTLSGTVTNVNKLCLGNLTAHSAEAPLTGYLDQVRIFTRVLSSNEVFSLYNAEK